MKDALLRSLNPNAALLLCVISKTYERKEIMTNDADISSQ